MSPANQDAEVRAGVPVGPFVREQILTCLRSAWRLASRDLSSEVERVRALAAEVVERIDAIMLVAAQTGGVAAAQPASQLRCTALSNAGGEPVREFLLIPFGEIVVERPVAGESFAFTRAHAESAQCWFDRMGRKLAVDYEHQSFDRFNTRRDGLRPAAGWIGGLEIRDDGLWAVNVTWTERAAELLRSGEYRYFSPVIFWTDEDHIDVAALGPVALTNDPAMRGVQALAARRDVDTPGASDGNGVETEAPEDSAIEWQAQLEAAQAEISLLRRQLAAQEADTFVERGLRLGKILDSTSMDWRADYLRDPQAAEERLMRAPLLLPPGRVIALDRQGQVKRWSPPVQRGGALRPLVGGSAVEPEDLETYERVAAAGRVVVAGA